MFLFSLRRFFPNGKVLSYQANEDQEISEVVHSLQPSLVKKVRYSSYLGILNIRLFFSLGCSIRKLATPWIMVVHHQSGRGCTLPSQERRQIQLSDEIEFEVEALFRKVSILFGI